MGERERGGGEGGNNRLNALQDPCLPPSLSLSFGSCQCKLEVGQPHLIPVLPCCMLSYRENCTLHSSSYYYSIPSPKVEIPRGAKTTPILDTLSPPLACVDSPLAPLTHTDTLVGFQQNCPLLRNSGEVILCLYLARHTFPPPPPAGD